MAEKFYSIVTNTGKAKIANCTALGTKVKFEKFKVGDGNGSYYEPTETQEDLVNQVWEGNITSIYVDVDNPSWIVIETVIPSDIGGFTIREAGIFDEDDNMLAIAKYPETYKPVISQGSAKDLFLRVIIEVSNTESITLKIDPSVALATKKDLENTKAEVDDLSDKIDKIKIDASKQSIILSDISITPNFTDAQYDDSLKMYYQDITITGEEDKFTEDSIVDIYPHIEYMYSDSTDIIGSIFSATELEYILNPPFVALTIGSIISVESLYMYSM